MAQKAPVKKGPPASASKMQAKGFPRVDVTPEYKNEFEKELRVAIIAAPSYANSGLPPLRFTLADAVELRVELERQGYKVRTIPTTEATADNIRKALSDQKMILDGTTQSTLLFAFSGHGFQGAGGGKNYLMTYGVSPEHLDQALSLDEVQQLMTATGARRKVILADACRNETDKKSADTARTFGQFREAEGFAVLLSTRPGGFSYEDPEIGHGVFTEFVLRGLRGKAVGKDGFVTFKDLCEFVQNQVLSYSMKQDKAQKPFCTGENYGDFLLGTAAPPSPEQLKASQPSTQISSDAPVMRALEINKAFFVILNENNLTLYDAATLQPFAVLTENPKMLTGAAQGGAKLRWFGGNGPSGASIHIVLQMNGSEMSRLQGRLGKPCPDGKPCSPLQYPLLPGESRPTTSSAIRTAKKGADALREGLGGLMGRRTNTASTTVSNSSAAVDRSGLIGDERDRFVWTPFNLTTNVNKPAQAAPAGAQ